MIADYKFLDHAPLVLTEDSRRTRTEGLLCLALSVTDKEDEVDRLQVCSNNIAALVKRAPYLIDLQCCVTISEHFRQRVARAVAVF